MSTQKKKLKNYKICVHIPLYLEKGKKFQISNFKKVCNAFLKLSNRTKIFVHSNKKLKDKNKNIKFFYYDFQRIKRHSRYGTIKLSEGGLTWFCRDLMQSQKNNYDIFIYSEEDILFTKKNFQYWLNHKDECINNNYNLGFARFEIKKKTFYSTDQVKHSKYYINILKKKYIVIDNPYCAFWIYDKNEFKKFVKTKFWEFDWKWITISGILLVKEMSAIGWHGINMNGIDMNRYLATVVPLKSEQLDKNSLIRHLSDKFSKAPAGLFGTFKIKDIPKKNLQIFKPITPLGRFVKRANYIFYYFLRINIKNILKNN